MVVSSWLRRGLVGVVSVAVLATGSVSPGWAAPAKGGSPAPSPGESSKPVQDLVVGSSGLVVSGGLSRPDWTSASVTARAARVPVEVLSARSETTRQWVYPDGHVRVEQATGPVRFKDSKGRDGWSDIDTTLIPDGSGFKASAVPGSVRIGRGGDPVVTDSSGSGSVAVSLPGVVLPDPVVSGSTATFTDVVPGVDVQVEVRPAGFQLVWLVKSAAGAAELVSRYGSSGQVVLPLTTSGAGLDAQPVSSGSSAGGVVFSRKGHRLGQLKTPVVWDSKNAVVNGVGVQVRGHVPGRQGAGPGVGDLDGVVVGGG